MGGREGERQLMKMKVRKSIYSLSLSLSLSLVRSSFLVLQSREEGSKDGNEKEEIFVPITTKILL